MQDTTKQLGATVFYVQVFNFVLAIVLGGSMQ